MATNNFYNQMGQAAGEAAGKAAVGQMQQQVYQNVQATPPGGPAGEEELSWWMKWLIKGGVTLAGSLAIICGLFTAISVSPFCIVGGILMMICSIIIVGLESPICCQWIQWMEKIQSVAANRPKWQKAAVYAVFAVVPLILCQSLATIFGFILIFACAALYGVLVIGRKADRDTMLRRAGGGGAGGVEAPPEHDQAGLVNQY